MRKDLTDITVVMDRSGSMATTRQDAEGGLNTFIGQQKEQPGEAIFSLVQFDTEYEFVHKAIPIRDVPPCSLVPRGNTALLDALGRAIIETGERLKNTPEEQRPGLVIIVVITDGQENSSTEFTRDKVREMIQHQTDVYKWQFTYIGANQDAFAEAGALGISPDSAANYANTQKAFGAMTCNVSRMRGMSSAETTVMNYYTDQEREEMSNE